MSYPPAEWKAGSRWSTDGSSAAEHSISAPPQSQSWRLARSQHLAYSTSGRPPSGLSPLWRRARCWLAGTSGRLEWPWDNRVRQGCGWNVITHHAVYWWIHQVVRILYSLKARTKVFNHSWLRREDLTIFPSQTLNSTSLFLYKMEDKNCKDTFIINENILICFTSVMLKYN